MPRKLLARIKRSLKRSDRQNDRLAEAEAARKSHPERALELYTALVEDDPGFALAHYRRANILMSLNRLEAALDGYDRAIALDPHQANVYCNRGVVLTNLGRVAAALDSYDQAILLDGGDALAFYNRATVLRALGQKAAALASLDRSLEIAPDYAEAHCNRGNLLRELDRPDEALASYARALEIQPGLVQAYFNRGVLLVEMRRCEAALQDLDRAIALQPTESTAHGYRGTLLALVGRDEAALESFDRAIELKPDAVNVLCQRAAALQRLGRHEAAILSYERALQLDPEQRFLLGTLRHVKMQVCNWAGLDQDLERLRTGIAADAPVSPPLPVLALVDSPGLLHQAARIWVREEHREPAAQPLDWPRSGERLRVGYFSADFHQHPVAILLAQVLRLHDRSAFEVTALSFGPNTRDDMRRRVESSVDRFIDVRQRTDRDIVQLARSLGLDIALDLGGHTANSRTTIFARRAAPLQVNYLGYAGTMGADYMDYLIGDHTVVPREQQRHYSEKIVYLPHTYLPNDGTRVVADRPFTRADLGLPATGFVFCCFNAAYKIMPATFDGWMRILRAVEHSVLWLSTVPPTAADSLRCEAARRGMDPRRLVFAERMPSISDHLARLRAGDLFLDTLPYNAHATAVDALWAGLPVLTCRGDSFAARVGASLLQTIRLPELIAESPTEYEAMAIRLATHPALLSELKRKLAHNRLTAPLFDTDAYTRHLEAAYRTMHARRLAGLPPDHIEL